MKREKLVDRLLDSPEFVEYWTFRLARMLRVAARRNHDPVGAAKYHDWLRDQLQSKTPFDRLARELITALGDSHAYGPANFHRTVADPREQAEFVAQVMMGVRLRCANCHNHPLDSWDAGRLPRLVRCVCQAGSKPAGGTAATW